MLGSAGGAHAQSAPAAAAPSGTGGQAIPPKPAPSAPEEIVVKAQRLLVKEKNSPSAVTELGSAQIAQTGVGGSVATLLRQVPSVYVYQQGIGNNEPVLSIRGVRGLETAQTLDGVPMQDLLNGGTGAYLQNNVGGYFNLDQISDVSVYPGVAYPDQNTFGTIGGTIAYASKRPADAFGMDVFGSVGSFGTYNEGFTLNSGRLDGPLGTGADAPKVMLQYSNLQTQGFIDNTAARYNNMDFALDKPYDGGLSHFQMTVLYNTGDGLVQDEPTPIPYLQANGLYSNFPRSQVFQSENNDYFALSLKNDTYVNDLFPDVGVTAFYRYSDSTFEAYENINDLVPPVAADQTKYSAGGAAPFVQNAAGFGVQSLQGPGGAFYDPAVSTYNPQAVFYPGSQYCPTKIVNEWASYGQTNPCGTNALLTVTHNDTYGIQPRVTIIPPEIYGIDNTIKIGGLVAKETQPNGPSYEWGSPNVPQSQANEIPGDLGGSGGVGGSMRAIYQLYAQDKVDMLENTLHITPGLTLEGSYSEFDSSQEFGGTPSAATLASAYCQAGNPCLYGNYKATKWDREWLPFFNVDYDFDKILPAAKGLSAYASWGESALFAPVTDFTPNVIGGVPSASIVHMYEGGLKYDTSRLALGVDYFYQDVDRDFGFFQFQSGPNQGLSEYDNLGKREFKGVEGSAQYQLTPELQLFGNGSHLLAKYLESAEESVTVFQDQFGIGFKDTPNTGVPDWVANFGVDYDKHNLWHDGDLLNLRLAGEYTGHQYTTYDLTGTTNAGSVPGVPPFGTYTYYTFTAGATTYDPHGGISPFAIFNMDLTYTLPTPALAFTHSLKFDLNIQNLFDHEFYQYFYKQISPTSCGTFTSGPFKGQPISNYGCTAQFSDALPGEPFAVTFTVTAHF